MRHRTSNWVLPVCSGLLLAAAAPAQEAAKTRMLTLNGVVLNGLTGKPLARALVRSGDKRIGAMTASDGTFAIEVESGLSANDAIAGIAFFPEKPDYEFVDQPCVAAFGESPDAKPLEFRLMPSASVTGHITAEGSEAARGVRVMLLEDAVQDGERSWRVAFTQATDSQGAFRFGNLHPGEYTVLTGEWPGEAPLIQPRTTVTRQYRPDFYGDTPELGTASRIRLRYGDTSDVQLHLQPTDYYPVTIPITGSGNLNQVQVQMGGAESFGSFRLGYARQDHSVHGALPSGDYVLNLSAVGESQEFARLPIHIGAAAFQSAGVALAPGSSIAVRVQAELTHQQPQIAAALPVQRNTLQQMVQISLHSVDQTNGLRYAEMASSGELHFPVVPPGTYWVIAQGYQGYVAGLSSGGVDLEKRPIEVVAGSSPQPIEVTLRDDYASVTANIQGEAATDATGLSAVFVPTDGAPGFIQNGFPGKGKSSATFNLAPGRYRAFAYRGRFLELAWRDDRWVQALNGKGAAITVHAGEKAELDVPLVDRADLEGMQP